MVARLKKSSIIEVEEKVLGVTHTAVGRYLVEQWGSRPIAEIAPELFFDFTVQRPRVRLDDAERVLTSILGRPEAHLVEAASAALNGVRMLSIEFDDTDDEQ